MAESLGEDSLDGVLTLGWYLLMHHRDHCNHGVLVDTQDDVDNLESWFKDTIEREGTRPSILCFVHCAPPRVLSVLAPESSYVVFLFLSQIFESFVFKACLYRVSRYIRLSKRIQYLFLPNAGRVEAYHVSHQRCSGLDSGKNFN